MPFWSTVFGATLSAARLTRRTEAITTLPSHLIQKPSVFRRNPRRGRATRFGPEKEHINEPASGQYVHVKEQRITEWPVEFLTRPRRTRNTIPDFLSPNAPAIVSTFCVAWRKSEADANAGPWPTVVDVSKKISSRMSFSMSLDFNDFSRSCTMYQFAAPSLGKLAELHPSLIADFKKLDAVKTAATSLDCLLIPNCKPTA